MLLRRTSVGCAVSTGTICAPAKKASSRSGVTPAVRGTRQSVRHCAVARHRVGERVSPAATDVMLVFGNVGEMGEKAEGADDLQRLARRQAVQRLFERAPGFGILVTMKTDRILPNAFNGVEHRLAALLAHRVTGVSARAAGYRRAASCPCRRYRSRCGSAIWTALLRANGSRCPLQKPCRSLRVCGGHATRYSGADGTRNSKSAIIPCPSKDIEKTPLQRPSLPSRTSKGASPGCC